MAHGHRADAARGRHVPAGKVRSDASPVQGGWPPTAASPVGVNATITIPGETGFLARTDDEWAAALKALVRTDNL